MLGLEEEVKRGSAGETAELDNSPILNNLHIMNPELHGRIILSIKEYILLTGAKSVRIIDSGDEVSIEEEMEREGQLIRLNPSKFPNSFLYRSSPQDVARSEKDTFTCTDDSKSDVGITNNWMSSIEAMEKAKTSLKNSMMGKTLYVVPYWLGPYNSPYGMGGLELTDSLYVTLNLIKITRVGEKAVQSIARSNSFVLGLHSTINLDPENRYIMHFPDENQGDGLIISFNTNYGGNALLSKKCHALRIASFRSRREGWMAEHMMLLGLQEPGGLTTYIAGAFPSSSGKTNLSMIEPPKEYASEGWKTFLISDDITWMHIINGGLNGLNPEYGFFGVAPHTSPATNPRAMSAISKNTIFTNVGIDRELNPYWEGIGHEPINVTDWKGNKLVEGSPAAHPNSRFTTPIKEYPNLSPEYENPNGAHVGAFLFGGRRSDLIPLVLEAKNWKEGVLFGAMQRVETTAAATGKVGELRNDPMAMRPFMPYNLGDYFSHYLKIGKQLSNPPKIYNVNWFRKDREGKFLWPGYGENLRVLEWINGRVTGKIARAHETAMGYVPKISDLRLGSVNEHKMEELLHINNAAFLEELSILEKFFISIGNHFPEELWEVYHDIRKRLEKASK